VAAEPLDRAAHTGRIDSRVAGDLLVRHAIDGYPGDLVIGAVFVGGLILRQGLDYFRGGRTVVAGPVVEV